MKQRVKKKKLYEIIDTIPENYRVILEKLRDNSRVSGYEVPYNTISREFTDYDIYLF